MCKHGSMEGKTRESAVQGRKVVGSLGRMMKGRTVSMEVKKGLRDGIIVPIITYASGTWVWNEMQKLAQEITGREDKKKDEMKRKGETEREEGKQRKENNTWL